MPEYVTKTVRSADKHREYELNNDVTYYYIELEKFRKQNLDMSNPLNQWLAFLDMERGDLLEMAKKNNKIIKEACEEYEILTGTEEMKRLAEVRLKSYLEEQSALATARDRGTKEGLECGRKEGLERGRKEGLERGRKEGLERGRKEKQKEIAKKMIEKNIPINQIVELTGLTKEDVKELKNDE